LEHAHTARTHTHRAHTRACIGVYGWPQVCVHILMLGGKKAGGKFTQSPSEKQRAAGFSYTLWKVCFLCVYKETNKTSVVCMYAQVESVVGC